MRMAEKAMRKIKMQVRPTQTRAGQGLTRPTEILFPEHAAFASYLPCYKRQAQRLSLSEQVAALLRSLPLPTSLTASTSPGVRSSPCQKSEGILQTFSLWTLCHSLSLSSGFRKDNCHPTPTPRPKLLLRNKLPANWQHNFKKLSA